MSGAAPPVVVIAEFMDDDAVAWLGRRFEVRYDPALVDRRAELLTALASARALIVRNRTRVDEELLGAAPSLEVVGRLGVGLDNIDLEACGRRNVAVRPATGANTVAVAEYVVGALLVLARGAFGATDRVVAGEWPRGRLIGHELAHLRLGLVGVGAIGRAVAARAAAFGTPVAGYDPYLEAGHDAWTEIARVETLGELLATSTAVSLHVPLTDATVNMIDGAAIAAMPPGSLLVNSSRGGLVDEPALVEALRSGHLGGAALDTFREEPLDAERGARFRDVPNLLLTPHVAGITVEANQRVSRMTAEQVVGVLGGPG